MKFTFTRTVFTVLLVFIAFTASFAAPTVSFTTAKAKAAREGKVLLVDFTASWCMPCKWMDETTFSDAQVLTYLTDHYVSIKIDIDDFDGFALKQQFHVETLPTIIFFSSDGKEVDRITEGVGAGELLGLLNIHNKPANRRVLGGEVPIEDWSEPFAKMSNAYAEEEQIEAPDGYLVVGSEQTPEIESTATAFSEAFSDNDEFLDLPRMATSVPAIETRKVTAFQVTPELNENSLRIQEIKIPEEANTSKFNEVADNKPVNTNVNPSIVSLQEQEEQVQVAPPKMPAVEARMFSLQAGAFSDQANAIRAADHLRDFTENPVLIEFDIANEKPIYRIYVGRFTDLKDAEEVSKSLYMHGFSCIPKELAMR